MHIESMKIERCYDDAPCFLFGFDEEVGEQLEYFTSKNTGNLVAMIINDHVVSVPLINGPISGGALEITGPSVVEDILSGIFHKGFTGVEKIDLVLE